MMKRYDIICKLADLKAIAKNREEELKNGLGLDFWNKFEEISKDVNTIK